MVTLRHITAAEVRNQQREIKREREREGNAPQPKEREGDRKIFHDCIRNCNC